MVLLGKIKYINPSLLKDNKSNPFKKLKRDEFIKFTESIKSKGIINPIVINNKNVILEGHNRKDAALFLKMEVVPVIIADVVNTEDEFEIQAQLNINRRQIGYNDKKKLIYDRYLDLIKSNDNRGKNRWESKTVNMAKLISSKTGIPEGTISRIIVDIKKDLLVKETKLGIYSLPEKNFASAVKLYKQYKEIEKKEKALKRERLNIKKLIEAITPIKNVEILISN